MIQWTRTNDGKAKVLRRDLFGNPVAKVTGPRTYEGVSDTTNRRYWIRAKGRGYVLNGQQMNCTATTTGNLACIKETAEWYDAKEQA